jgi:hypothetical protein
MVVVPMQNDGPSCIALASTSAESLGVLVIHARSATRPLDCKTSTPGSNPGGASNSNQHVS